MMDVIYQLTFFAALALFAILITVFVFAVSLLGRALETAARSEKEKITERKERNAKQIADIKKDIEEAETKGEIPTGLIQKLEGMRIKDKKYDKELSKIRRAPELLTVRVGVVHPGICLTLALILSGGAWFYRDIGTSTPITLWLLGLAAIGYSAFRIYKSLRVIESVAITSEAESERRLSRAVKTALVEVEEEKKPRLCIAFEEEQPPFHLKIDEEKLIDFTIFLAMGQVARKARAFFLAPPGFGFKSRKTWVQPKNRKEVANFITTKVELEHLISGVNEGAEITVKAPSKAGKYIFKYRLTCEGFDSGYEEFKVIVK